MEGKEVKCPKCGIENPIYIEESNSYICRKEGCEHKFELEIKPVSKKIFISHGHDESEGLASKLRGDLEELGYGVWFDLSHLKAGIDWETSIENGLKSSQVVISLMTPFSMRRPDGFCLNELSMASTLRKEIIPIMVRDCLPPLSIHRIQWLDFREWPNISEEKYKEKVFQIRDMIEGKGLSFEGVQAIGRKITGDSGHDTFISYAKENKNTAYSICESLENEGMQCWIAPRDILPSESYPKAIVSAIKSSHLMIVILSKFANHSPHVMRELERALNNKIPIMPFKIEDLELSEDMEYIIGSTHWLDASTAPLESHIPKLIESIKSILKPD